MNQDHGRQTNAGHGEQNEQRSHVRRFVQVVGDDGDVSVSGDDRSDGDTPAEG